MKLIIRNSNGEITEQEITGDLQLTPTAGEQYFFTGVEDYTFNLTNSDSTLDIHFLDNNGDRVNVVLHDMAGLIQQNNPLNPFSEDTSFGVSTNQAGDQAIEEVLNNKELQSGEIVQALKDALSMDGSTLAGGAVIDDFQGLLDGLDATATGETQNTAYNPLSDSDNDQEVTPSETTSEQRPDSYENGDNGFDRSSGSANYNVNHDPTLDITTSVTVDEDGSKIISFTTNDIDGDTVTVRTEAENGTVRVENGEIIYEPNENYNGEDTITVTASDGNGGVVTKTIDVTIDPVNDLPTVEAVDTINVTEDGIVSGKINASDVDGDELIFSTTSEIEGLTLNSDGTYTFDADSYDSLDLGENQILEIPVTVSDGNGGDVQTTLTIDVAGINNDITYVSESAGYKNVIGYYELDDNGNPTGEAKVIIDDQNGMAGGTHLDDLDPNTEYGFFIIANGANEVDENSVITFDTSGDIPVLLIDGDAATKPVYHDTPAFNGDGKDHFVFEADGNGGTNINIEDLPHLGDADFQDVVLNVNFELADKIGDDLQAHNDTVTTNEDSAVTIDVLRNDRDGTGDNLTITDVQNPVMLNGIEVGTAEIVNDKIVFTPNDELDKLSEGEVQNLSIKYDVSDGNLGNDSAVVTIKVQGTNDAPEIEITGTRAVEDTAQVIGNVTDIDGEIDNSNLTAQNGEVNIDTNGNIIYIPNDNFNGTDSVTISVTDNNGATTTQTLDVTVTAVNDGPVAKVDSVETTEDTELTINASELLANDSDVDGDTLTISSVGSATHGTVSLDNDGNVVFTPDANYNGEASFTYTISDGNGGTDSATVTLNVTSVNDIPTIDIQSTATVNEDGSLTIDSADWSASDLEDGDLTPSFSANNGTVSLDNNGNIVYTPNENYNGSDTITVSVTDSNGATTTETINVTVNNVNDGPVATDDSIISNEVFEDTRDHYSVGDTKTVSYDLGEEANEATVSVTGLGGASWTETLVINAYDSEGNLVESFSFEGDDNRLTDFTINTDTPFTSLEVSGAGIEFNNGNTGDAHFAIKNVTASMSEGTEAVEDTPLTIDTTDLLVNDTDTDGDTLTITSVQDATNGTVSLDNNGNVVFTPDANYNGEATFTYTISDGNGGTDTATVTLNVTAVNDEPTIEVIGQTTVSEDGTKTISFTTDDIDGDTVLVTGSATNGTVSIENGQITYTPNENFNGSDSISVTINDGNGGVVTKTIDVTVNPINDAPTIDVQSTANVNEDGSLTIDSADWSASDLEDGDLTPSFSANNGTVSLDNDGNIVYTPNENYNGSDTITVSVTDSGGITTTETINVTVNAVNDAISYLTDSDNTQNAIDENVESGTYTGVTLNATDVDGDTITYSLPDDVPFKVLDNGQVVTDGAIDFEGNESFTFMATATSSDGTQSTTEVTINVNDIQEDTIADEVIASMDIGDAVENTTQQVDLDAINEQGLIDNGDGTYSKPTYEETAKLYKTEEIEVGTAKSIRLDDAPDHGTVEVNLDGEWTEIVIGQEYDADIEVRFTPNEDALSSTSDTGIGTFGENVGEKSFSETVELSDWGDVAEDGKSVTFTEGNLSVTTSVIQDGSAQQLGTYNKSGNSVGAGIGDKDSSGLSRGEVMRVEFDGEEINQVEFQLDGLGSYFDEDSKKATEVKITAYDSDGNEIDTQGGYRQSGEYDDIYSFTTTVPVAYFELTTEGSQGNYVVQNMTLSKTVVDEVTFTAIADDGSELTLTSDINIEAGMGTTSINSLVPVSDVPMTKEVRVVDEDAMAEKGAIQVDGTWVIQTGTEIVDAPMEDVVDSYEYPVDFSAQLTDTDGSETLSDITVDNLPDGATLTGENVTDNGDGTFTVGIDDNGEAHATIESDTELSEDEINEVTASVTSTENSTGDTFTSSITDDGEISFLDDTDAIDFGVILENSDDIHTINLESEPSHTLTLDADDIVNANNDHEMVIVGDDGDIIDLEGEGWTKQADHVNVDGEEGEFDVYSSTSEDGTVANVYVDTHVTVNTESTSDDFF